MTRLVGPVWGSNPRKQSQTPTDASFYSRGVQTSLMQFTDGGRAVISSVVNAFHAVRLCKLCVAVNAVPAAKT